MEYTNLGELLTTNLTDTEVQGLYSSLDIDADPRTTGTKADRVKQLIAQCENEGRLDELVDACRKLRPDLSWQALAGTTDGCSDPDESRDERSGGVDVNSSGAVSIGGDVVGRDKIVDNSIRVGDITGATGVAVGDRASVTIIQYGSLGADLLPLLSYSKALEQRLTSIVKHYTPLPLHGRHPPQTLSILELASETPEQLDERCPTQAMLRREFRVLLVADGGAGKTMALQRFAWRAASEFSRNPSGPACPIFISLHDYDGDLLKLIGQTLHIHYRQISEQEYMRQLPAWLERRMCSLVLDGLNEVSEDLLSQLMIDLQSISKRYPLLQIRLSSRPSIAPATHLGFTLFRIAPLPPGLIQEMIVRSLDVSPARTKLLVHLRVNDESAWRQPSSRLRLAQLPLAVYMLGAIAKAGLELPRTPSRTFERFISLQLKDWEDRATRRSPVSAEEKLDALSRLAFNTIHEGVGMRLTYPAARSLFGDALGAEDILNEVIESGLLRRSGDNLEWWHQGIRDYCAARHLFDQYTRGEDLQPFYSQLRWDEVITLVTGMVPDPFRLIEVVAAPRPYLAARCLWENQWEQLPEDLMTRVRAQLLDGFDEVWRATGDLAAITYLFEPVLDRTTDYRVLTLLGNLEETQLRYQEAQKWYEQALKLASDVDARLLLMCKIGTALRRLKLHREAQKWLLEAEALSRASGQWQRDGLLYYELGYIAQKEGMPRKAIRAYSRSYKAELRKGDINKALIEKAVTASLLLKCHRFESALALALPCVEQFERLDNVRWLINTLQHIAEIYINLRQLSQARDYIARAVEVDQKRMANSWGFVNARRYEGLLLIAENKWLQACEVLEEGLAAMDRLDLQEQITETLHPLGTAYYNIGEVDKAKQVLTRATTAPVHEQNKWGAARAYRELATIYKDEPDYRRAVEALVRSKVLFKELHSLETRTLRPLEDTLRSILGPAHFESLYKQFVVPS
jgi:tetratricopeptide (TPR) repeat protein